MKGVSLFAMFAAGLLLGGGLMYGVPQVVVGAIILAAIDFVIAGYAIGKSNAEKYLIKAENNEAT